MYKPPMIRTSSQVTVILNGKPMVADTSHGNYKLIVAAIDEGRFDDLEGLFDVAEAVKTLSHGKYTITDDEVLYEGNKIPSAIERRVLQFMSEGQDFKPLLAFHERVSKNPSYRSVEELYTFLEHKNIPLDDEGFFYAYKAIRPDWRDIYTGTVDNSIGATPHMPRNNVDDNCNHHCSRGYHVGSLEYVRLYGHADSRYVICKVDPAEVVSVPVDHQCQKVRVTGYEVVSEFTGALPETRYSNSFVEANEEEESWDEVEDDCDLWRDELEDERQELLNELQAIQSAIDAIDDELS